MLTATAKCRAAQAAGKARAYTVEVETIFENLLQDMTAVRDTVGDGCEW